MKFFEGIRSPFLDGLFSFFSFWGEGTALTVAVILCYWLLGKTGEYLAVSTLTTLPLNVFLKTSVARNRPFVDNVVSRVEIDNFFVDTMGLKPNASFPSGHAQTSANFLSSVCIRAKKWWAYAVCAPFVLMIMCSRLYFGVHYPSDVLTGLALGVAVAVFWQIIYTFAYRARYFILLAFALLALVPFFFFLEADYAQAAGLLGGIAVGLPFCNRFAVEPKGLKRLWRIPAGLLSVALPAALLLLLNHFLPDYKTIVALPCYFLLALSATLGGQTLFRAFKI